MFSGVKGSWIIFILISEVTYATQCLLSADSARLFFSLLNHSAWYCITSEITVSSYPEKYFSKINCYSLLKYKLFINIRLSDIQNPSKNWKLAWKHTT